MTHRRREFLVTRGKTEPDRRRDQQDGRMPSGLMVAGLVLVGAALAIPALGQNAPILATPLPPLQRQWQQQGSPPVQEAPVSPGDTSLDTGSDDQGQAPVNRMTPPATAERPNIWVPAGAAKLQALDKVNAQASQFTIKVGQSATFGSLTITVKSCMVRPPDQPADAAAYLDVTDDHPDAAGFDGWLLADEPSVSMMQHPIYDLRVTGCT